MNKGKLGLFEAYGIEIEYMIVDQRSMKPVALAEKVLVDADGQICDEIDIGEIAVSNELAAHVIELKSAGPTADLSGPEKGFVEAVAEINARLAPYNACLAPSGAHPFMDPSRDSCLWPYGNKEIYEAYDRIFSCKGHGWMNLQSCHLNLPFRDEDEFARLHAAIILVLPYLPALSASTPYLDGKYAECLDVRLKVYRKNQARVPEIAGDVVPEPVFSFKDYQEQILQKTYAAIAPLDKEGLLQEEWLNSRGAIARFDRNAIEIRVLDAQECPAHDLAICALIIETLRHLCSLPKAELLDMAKSASSKERCEQLYAVVDSGYEAPLLSRDLAGVFSLSIKQETVGELWRVIFDTLLANGKLGEYRERLECILSDGNLSERLVACYGTAPSREDLESAVQSLAGNLSSNTAFSSRALV